MRAALARVPRVIPINGLLVRLGSSLLKFLLFFALGRCLAIRISDEGLVAQECPYLRCSALLCPYPIVSPS
jgi:hypothetical protein